MIQKLRRNGFPYFFMKVPVQVWHHLSGDGPIHAMLKKDRCNQLKLNQKRTPSLLRSMFNLDCN